MRVIYFISLLFSVSVFAADKPIIASFDCKKSKSEMEKEVCSDASMADLDRVLGEVYKRALKSEKDTADLGKSQKAWLKTRDECLENLPVEKIDCIVNAYAARIKKLGGTDDLIKLYQSGCKGEVGDDCPDLGRLLTELKRWTDVEKTMKPICDKNNDGTDLSCSYYAKALEQEGKKSDALAVLKKNCSASRKAEQTNLEACANAYRLGGKKSKNAWVGMYQTDNGLVFVEESGSELELHLQSSFANGHSCTWNGSGVVKGNAIKLDPDAENEDCKLKIEKSGDTLSISDPDSHCKDAYCGERGSLDESFKRDSSYDP